MKKLLLSLATVAAFSFSANADIIQNGGFENWTEGTPDHWKPASTAGNATLEQSTDAHAGNYSVQVDGYSSNKRLAYEEITLTAGTYTVSFYAKSLGGATSEYGPQCRPGYVPVNNGTVGDYKYGDYASLSEEEWTKVTYEFTLDATTTLCPVVMNAKNSGNILVDDYAMTTSDGGVTDGGDTPDDPVQPGDVQAITIAEFLANADTETTYQLTGVVQNISNTTYGNFYLEDETGSIYIYGLLNANGETKKFAEMGIDEGDELTLQGTYTLYNETPEIKNAQYISHKKGGNPEPPVIDDVQTITIEEFLNFADNATTYQLVGTVSNIQNTTYGNFDLVDATGSIYIYGLLNAAGESKKFAEMDIEEGDELTLQGVYTTYNDMPEIKNAQYVSHKKAGSEGISTVAVDLTSAVIFDICGQRVNNFGQKGIYIVNGKKYIVK